MPDFTGVSHIELTVRDANASAEWYERVLGMRRLVELSEHTTPGVSARVINLVHPTARFALGLITHDSGDEDAFSEFRVGLDHLALEVDTRSELEKWSEHLNGCGALHSAITDMEYGSVLVFRDPDNIQLEFFVYSNIYG
jgi:catechol 2,3-dioxygenase-like lactoylglutathione lyase family enzyme